MKQIITKWNDAHIAYKYYENNLGKRNGLFINYYYNGNLFSKSNWVNGEKNGLFVNYNRDNKIEKIKYYL